jgi:hypothetical protein
MYKVFTDKLTNQETAIVKDNGFWVPMDEGNSDYQEYLKWVEQGNVAEPWLPEEV